MIQDSPQERRRTSRRRSQKHHRWKKTQPIRNTQCNSNSNNSNTTNQPTNKNDLTELEKQPTTGDQRSPSSARHSTAPALRLRG
uniref:GH04046p n=1 Tax=Drosophila melanogaster TaxID=7227 RepID=Q8SZK1_DROME